MRVNVQRKRVRQAVACVLFTLTANAAFAGGFSEPQFATPHPPLPQIDDWRGFYAGGMLSFDSGYLHFTNATTNPPISQYRALARSVTFGGFGGYNFQRGGFVYGLEGAVSSGGIPRANSPQQKVGTIFDIKARAGYTSGSALFYGTAGWSLSQYDNFGSYHPLSGINFGAGIDYRINDQLFIGVEYLVRDIAGDGFKPGNVTRAHIQSAQLRVGWRF